MIPSAASPSAWLARPLAEIAEHGNRRSLAFGYADDILLRAPRDQAHATLQHWCDLLALIGLTVNPAKTTIWSLSSIVPPSLEALVGHHNVSRDGLTVCGLPLQASLAMRQQKTWQHDLPVGSAGFIASFPDAKLAIFRQCLSTLSHMLDTMGLNSTALHVITHILKVGAQGCFVHLFRFLPAGLARMWATRLDALVLDHLCSFPWTSRLPLPSFDVHSPKEDSSLCDWSTRLACTSFPGLLPYMLHPCLTVPDVHQILKWADTPGPTIRLQQDPFV